MVGQSRPATERRSGLRTNCQQPNQPDANQRRPAPPQERRQTMNIRTIQTLIALAWFANIHQAAAQGSLDPAFGTGIGAEDAVQTLAMQSDGKIMAAGLFSYFNGTANSIGIARLNTNGSVDSSFNPGTSVECL